MNFTQQELLRNFMKKLGFTRKEFVEFYLFPKYKISLRTLTNWLLPSESKEYKKIPDLTYRELCAAYFHYIEYAPKNRSLNIDTYTPGFTFKELDYNIVFPALWYTRGYRYIPEELEKYVSTIPEDRKIYTETISFKSNEDTSSNSFVITDRHEYQTPHQVYGENFWITVMRFESEPEAVASMRTYVQLDIEPEKNISECFGEIISYDNAFYVLMAQPSPSWYKEPLIIYTYQRLHKIVTGDIIADSNIIVVTQSGKLLTEIPRRNR